MTGGNLHIEKGAWRAEVVPQGGLLGALTRGGVPILRQMAEGSAGPLAAACFPMVPWCNRIADGRFEWADSVVALAPNFPPERHALHGHGWQSEWAVESHMPERCVLLHRHDGSAPGWPWAYEARQTFSLTDSGCAITLALTNLSAQTMPAGIGLHPYLRRRPESRLRFAARGLLEVGVDLIPTGQGLPPAHFGDFAQGTGLPPETVDHCFTGWNGRAEVRDALGTITLTTEGACALHVYAPLDPAILCLEPVNHWPDAANTGTMPLCMAGETVSLTLRIGVD